MYPVWNLSRSCADEYIRLKIFHTHLWMNLSGLKSFTRICGWLYPIWNLLHASGDNFYRCEILYTHLLTYLSGLSHKRSSADDCIQFEIFNTEYIRFEVFQTLICWGSIRFEVFNTHLLMVLSGLKYVTRICWRIYPVWSVTRICW